MNETLIIKKKDVQEQESKTSTRIKNEIRFNSKLCRSLCKLFNECCVVFQVLQLSRRRICSNELCDAGTDFKQMFSLFEICYLQKIDFYWVEIKIGYFFEKENDFIKNI